MPTLPNCHKCHSEYSYQDGSLLICPECAYEWPLQDDIVTDDGSNNIHDANGNVLQGGDTVTVIKELKVKSSSLVVEAGTRVKNIRLIDGDHNIDSKIDRTGAIKLKLQFVKKI